MHFVKVCAWVGVCGHILLSEVSVCDRTKCVCVSRVEMEENMH